VTEAQELETLFPTGAPKKVSLSSVRGEEGHPVVVDVLPIRVGQLAILMRAVKDMWPLFNDPEKLDVQRLVIEHTDAIVMALAVALNTDREMIEELDLADLVVAVTAVVEVNADFFTQRLLPELDRAAKKIDAVRGQTSASA